MNEQKMNADREQRLARRKISKSVRACLWASMEAFLSACIRRLAPAFEAAARSFLSAFVSSLREDVNKTARNLFAKAKHFPRENIYSRLARFPAEAHTGAQFSFCSPSFYTLVNVNLTAS